MFQRIRVVIIFICIGIGLLGILGSLIPFLSASEENLGLQLLYRLRGPEPPPADVVVVAIDRESAKALNLPTAPHKWPRILHARLLEQLTAQHAAVVVFDLIFYEHQEPANDRAFAAAVRKAGNVILTQTIDRRTLPLDDGNGNRKTQVNIEKIVSAIPILADAALGQAPFPLPKVPIQLSQYWRFRPGSGDVPTLPVVALHAYAGEAIDPFLRLLQKLDPAGAARLLSVGDGKTDTRNSIDSIRPIYRLFEKNPSLASRMLEELESRPPGQMSARQLGMVKALIDLYRSGDSRYLNLYGPPGTVTTISYQRLLASNVPAQAPQGWPALKGKAVFVGQTESDWYKANDGFYTAFTDNSGLDISGVEIAATAFANLLDHTAVHPLAPSAYIAILLGWGGFVAFTCLYFPTAGATAGLLLLNGSYIALAYAEFKSGGTWYPLIIPILVQTPAAYIAGLVWKYRKANAERRNIRQAFGYYLPDAVVDRLATNLKALRSTGQNLYGICLFTDAESYTTLSESLDPESLTQLMNAYYEAIFKPIKDNDGLILQVVGDSVLAIWASPQPKNDLREAACRAAIGITDSVQRFNSKAGHHPLPTRIGIHAGEILLGNIGAMDHFEYRPVGDIVNTASRLEGLNKYLGTRMLASEEAFSPDDACPTRPVGRFVFKGKSIPVSVREIFPGNGVSPEVQAAVGRAFDAGLQAFQGGSWDKAQRLFIQVLQMNENDGPSRFYLKLCREFLQKPPGGDWDGAVHLTQK